MLIRAMINANENPKIIIIDIKYVKDGTFEIL